MNAPDATPAVEDAQLPIMGGEPVLMNSIQVYGKVVFHKEILDVGDALALRLSDFGPFTPIHATASPYTALTQEWSRITRGEYVKNGQCTDPPSPAFAMRSANPDAVAGEASIRCKEICVLTVLFRDSESKAEGRKYHERVRSKWTLELSGETPTWATQISNASFVNVPLETEGGGGMGVLGMLDSSRNSPQILIRDEVLDDHWADTYDKSTFEAATADFAVCAAQAKIWRDWYGIKHHLEINTAGAVTRCENAMPDHLTMTNFDCECAALKNHVNFGPGQTRRIYADFRYYPGPTERSKTEVPIRADGLSRSVFLTDFSGEDPYASALATNALPYDALDACTSMLGETEELVPIRFDVDAQGKPIKIETSWPDELKGFGVCAEPILRQVTFACPHSATTLNGHLKIAVVPYRRR